jgi:hypothetical protein
MEQFLLTCLQAQLLIGRLNTNEVVTDQQKDAIVWELRQVTEKSCFVDAKDD